jgi:hypothetical protein
MNRGTPASARVLLDDSEVLTTPLKYAVVDGDSEVSVGLSWFTDRGWKIRYDDALIELR